MSNQEVQELLKRAKIVRMTPEQKEQQRQSFAYGNAKIENSRISRESIRKAAEILRGQHG